MATPWSRTGSESAMIVATTPTDEGHPAAEYAGVVVGEAIPDCDVINTMLMVSASGTAAR